MMIEQADAHYEAQKKSLIKNEIKSDNILIV